MIKRPLLAGNAPTDLSTLNYPVILSPKYDGIRCIAIGGIPYSRSMKVIPNQFIQQMFHDNNLDGLDGELYLPFKSFSEISSAVMSVDGLPMVHYVVFDNWIHKDKPYYKRLSLGHSSGGYWVHYTDMLEACNEAQVLSYEQDMLAAGFEGIMIRDPNGRYKEGRSTTKEGILLKLKRFTDDEATVIGFTELMINNNASEVNAVGLKEKSSCKANLEPAGTLGNLVCRNKEGVEFEIGTGFDDVTRDVLWVERDNLIGKLVKYKYQKVGVKERPRFPVFLGLRSELDL